jgi:DNA-binding NarL/FixJ family response regulator
VIRVFIAAASPLARASLENLLVARGVEVAGSVANIEALVSHLSDLAVDAILIESSGEAFEPLMDSLVASGLASDVSVVLLGEGVPPSAFSEALRAGISAVLSSDISPDQLVAALQAAASGLVVLHPGQFHSAIPTASVASRPLGELAEPLTPRESEVLQMLASGLGNKEIAAKLRISEHTVKFHVASILGKLGAASRTEAVSLGIRRGLVLL